MPTPRQVVALLLFWEDVFEEQLTDALDIRPEDHERLRSESQLLVNQAKSLSDLFCRKFHYRVYPLSLRGSPDVGAYLEAAFQWLLERFDLPGYLIIVYYGGHASRKQTLSLVPSPELYNGDPPTIDCRAQLARLCEKRTCAEVAIILDCCFSGGIIPDIRPRHVALAEDGSLIPVADPLEGLGNTTGHALHYFLSCSKSAKTPIGRSNLSFTQAFVDKCHSSLVKSSDGICAYELMLSMHNSDVIETPIYLSPPGKGLVFPVLSGQSGSFTQIDQPQVISQLRRLEHVCMEQAMTWEISVPRSLIQDNITQLAYLCQLDTFLACGAQSEDGQRTGNSTELGQRISQEIDEAFQSRPRFSKLLHPLALRACNSYFDGLAKTTGNLLERVYGQIATRILSKDWNPETTPSLLLESPAAWITNICQQAAAKALIDRQNLTGRVEVPQPTPQMRKKVAERVLGNGFTELEQSKQYQLASYKDDSGERNVLVEAIFLDQDAYSGAMAEHEYERVKGLACHLSLLDRTQFRVPRCRGYAQNMDDPTVCGLVFDWPEKRHALSLYEILGGHDEKPSRERRQRIAYLIARAVARLHLLGWVHKGVRSSNILLPAGPGSSHELDFASPWLLGYSFARRDSAGSWKLQESNALNKLYTHFTRWEDPAERFNKLHDIYSLGILMFEVGTFNAVEKYGEEAAWESWQERGQPSGERLVQFLKDVAREDVSFYMGQRYGEATLACLGAFGTDSPLFRARDDPQALWDAFHEEVIVKIECFE